MLRVLDVLFGWLLAIPRDAAIVLLAVATSAGMTLVRRRLTNQDRLHRVSDDLATLKRRLAEAKRAGDREAAGRVRATQSAVRLVRLPAEGRVLLVALLPLALLGWWGVERLDLLPYRANAPITLTAEYRASAAGRLTHLVPPERLALSTNAIQVVPSAAESTVVRWTLTAASQVETDLLVRCAGKTVTHPLRAAGRAAALPEQNYDTGPISRTTLDVGTYRSPLARLLPAGWSPEPGWMWWYLLLTLALTPVCKRLFNVA